MLELNKGKYTRETLIGLPKGWDKISARNNLIYFFLLQSFKALISLVLANHVDEVCNENN